MFLLVIDLDLCFLSFFFGDLLLRSRSLDISSSEMVMDPLCLRLIAERRVAAEEDIVAAVVQN